MSNPSWDHDFSSSEEESQKLIPGKKHIRKLKDMKGKNDKQISHTNKKKKCQFYNRGACMKGSQCPFSHSFIPDVAKKICKQVIKDTCSKGDSCPYSHNTKRYPCKMMHINQSCLLNEQCPFSHTQIDPEFEEEFLMDNQQFLISAFKSNIKLPHKYSLFLQNHDLLNENRKTKVMSLQPALSLPFFFGLDTYQTASRQQKLKRQANHKKSQDSKKISTNEQPFTIRLIVKNRQFIPEKLEEWKNDNEDNHPSQSYAGSVKSSSEFQKNELLALGYDKICQGIQLTPQSKSSRLGQQYYMCS